MFKFWKERFRESFERTRGKVELILFALFLMSGFILLLIPSLSMDKATWLIGLGLFCLIFAIEILFVSPYRLYKTMSATIKDQETKLSIPQIAGNWRRQRDGLIMPIKQNENDIGSVFDGPHGHHHILKGCFVRSTGVFSCETDRRYPNGEYPVKVYGDLKLFSEREMSSHMTAIVGFAPDLEGRPLEDDLFTRV
jgi:hypothetical protein